MDASKIRQFALIGFILLVVATLVFLWLIGQYILFWAVFGCGVSVIVGEIVSFLTTGESMSTNFTSKIKSGNKPFIFGLIACVALALSMVFLGVHLLWH